MADNNEDNIGEVIITDDDAKHILRFFNKFYIPIPKRLRNAVTAFTAEPTYENQQLLKLELCKAIAKSKHSMFDDEIFGDIIERSKEIIKTSK
jgi:hypothetical protein